ncbi:cellulose synthase-like protein G2 [Mangifera indica]|uniref:cellulose synthase-like protein G2 n=1 Tax=Mangifera indica TaxID=29780 RepID=UPI001CFBDA6F|nr:cellulose synthase-like protein G2 [Mangifera indica]
MEVESALHTCKVHQSRATTSRLHIFFHLAAISFLLYYRLTNLFHQNNPLLSFAWALITVSEFILAFIWTLTQAFRWLPVSRTVSVEKIPSDVRLPGIDVFVCTADPQKEPAVEVMNTVISALALDYPTEKLSVYLSDDGGSYVSLYAIKEAFEFAKSWVPFCKEYGIKTRCPEAYFSMLADDERLFWSDEFKVQEEEIKTKYENFKSNVEKVGEKYENNCVSMDRPPYVEIIHDKRNDNFESKDEETKMPRLVYVSRERRPSFPHRFKAGALNTLLRVSGIISNAPYILVLDCDMVCNDPNSAKQAMCFHLDPQMSHSLAFVQYPQVFYNVSKNDIYDGQSRSAYKTKWQGMDGLRGPLLSGTGFYMKRNALFGSPNQEDKFLAEPEKNFGTSNKLIDSLRPNKEQDVTRQEDSSESTVEEAKRLASCSYEQNTQWGKEVGFSYDCLLESTFTGYLLHCKGWKSVYLYPERPCFLGCTTIDMKDAMVQLMKWSSELIKVALSKFSPLTYGMSRMSFLQSMCYGYFTFQPLLSVALLLYGIVPQLCLLTGTTLYPKVSSPWFAAFLTLYFSSLCHHVYDVLSTGGTLRTVWNEQRIWIIKSVSGSLFGCLDMVMKRIGVKKANPRLTNKAVDKERLEKYEKGVFDFEGAKMFTAPLAILAWLNIVCFFGGVIRVSLQNNIDQMFGQLFLSSINLILSLPILGGMIAGKNK